MERSIIVVGSSGSGKTTAVNALRVSEFDAHVVIPRRYVTRPQRLGDDTSENEHISEPAFFTKVAAGNIFPYWSRDLAGLKYEHYGFDLVDINDGRLPVYSANNAFLRYPLRKAVTKALLQSTIVVVQASLETRQQRIEARSPDMSEDEKVLRLEDSASDILCLAGVEVMDTTDMTIAECQQSFTDLVVSRL